jgi:hemoglobin-like flavoprotein
MTRTQILLVQKTFELVAPIADTIALLFYARLFELDPSLRALFQDDMQKQQRKLMDTLTFIVTELADIELLLPVAEALARRHQGYGVSNAHYALVGDALIWALDHGLGEWFTPRVRGAWLAAYGTLSGAMMNVKPLPPMYDHV